MSTSPQSAVPLAPLPVGLGHGRELDLAGGPDAALLLHGLTGSTFELHYLAARLAEAGLRVLAPVMAGHGGAPEALCGVPWTAWVSTAADQLRRLADARHRFVVGSSMGALVACALAADPTARVDGLVLLAPALELTWTGRLGTRLGQLGPLGRRVIAKGRSDVRDPPVRALDIGLPGLPLGALVELAALADHVEPLLPGITAPTLVVAGGQDHTVTRRGVRRLAARLGSPVALKVLPESFHLIGVDVERERCAEEALRFLEPLRRSDVRSGAGGSPNS
jgi:carboxylesterase